MEITEHCYTTEFPWTGGQSMLYKGIEILISTLILLPVFFVMHKRIFADCRKTAGYFVFATYLSAVYLFVGMPTLQFIRFDVSVTWIPFLPMLRDLKNTILNIILFVPLGMLLPFLWVRYHTLRKTVIFGFCMSLAIELLQMLTYRATDINDIIANTAGALLGYLLFRVISQCFPSITGFAVKENEVVIVMMPVFFVMFFIQPYIASLYYSIL